MPTRACGREPLRFLRTLKAAWLGKPRRGSPWQTETLSSNSCWISVALARLGEKERCCKSSTSRSLVFWISAALARGVSARSLEGLMSRSSVPLCLGVLPRTPRSLLSQVPESSRIPSSVGNSLASCGTSSRLFLCPCRPTWTSGLRQGSWILCLCSLCAPAVPLGLPG